METEIFLVFLVTIMLLNKRMSEDTVLPVGTFLLPLDVLAHLGSIKVAITLSIFGVMVVYAVFMVVIFGDVARIDFKVV